MSEKEILKGVEERATKENKNYWQPVPDDYILFYAKKEIDSGFEDGRKRWVGFDRDGKEIVLPTSQILSDRIYPNRWYFIKYVGKQTSTKHKGWNYNNYLVSELTDDEIEKLKLEPEF